MGKKVKKKVRNVHKERMDLLGSKGIGLVESNTNPNPNPNPNPPGEVVGEGVLEVKGRVRCPHIETCIDLDKISWKIGPKDAVRCEDCREGSNRKGRSKHGKKGAGTVGKKKETSCVWVCLQCGQVSCGGVGLPTNPQSHAIRHSRLSRHPCVIQFQNPNLCWCFQCKSLIPVGNSEDDGMQNDVLSDVVKLIKEGVSEGASVDVEDIWFGGANSGGGTTESVDSDRKGGYAVRGLANLGNTCFFNSVMQNLLAMDKLRDFFLKLDCSVGPLTMALKKLFDETSAEADSRYGISPKNLFGSICSRAPQFKGFQQQDSHELLCCLLDGLCTEELNMRKSVSSFQEDGISSNLGPTFVDAIFGGQLSSSVSCMECKYSSVVYEPFLDLSLPVPTKKSPSKKVPPVSRPKKGKFPMKHEAKKGGKIRGKGKIDSVPVLVPRPTGSSETIESSSLASSSALEGGKVDGVDYSSSWLDFLDPDSSSLEPSSVLEGGKGDVSDDSLFRLDFVGPELTSNSFDSVSQSYDTSSLQVSESKHISHDDDVLQISSESQIQVFSPSIESKQDSELPKENYSENDLPLLESSKVVLLPYKEESSTTGETSGKDGKLTLPVSGPEQESLDFEGFGDLFNEPEMDSVPNSDNRSSQQFEATQTSALAGHSSESDPDEVDDRDAPVSINSCLAYFTKPELLSDEHAWHCENCSNTLQSKQVYSKENQSKTTVRTNINGVQLRNQNDPLDGELLSSAAESRSVENDYSESDFGPTTERGEDLLHSRHTPQERSPSVSGSRSSSPASFVDQPSGSSSLNDLDSTGSNANQVHITVSESKVKAHESKDRNKGDGKCVKVMRNATKRILIDKAPQILTIHLKRFSQDARGRLSKLNGHVSFSDKIDLSPFMSLRPNEENKHEYHLIGIVEHSGTMRGGHYVAYVRGGKKSGKTEEDDNEYTWFYASDSHVREVSLAEVFRSEAYLLFYV